MNTKEKKISLGGIIAIAFAGTMYFMNVHTLVNFLTTVAFGGANIF